MSKGQVYCFADDAAICYTSDSWEETHRLATEDLTNLQKWYTSMSLQLNFNKTSYMTFSIDNRGQPRNYLIQVTDIDQKTITIQRQTHVRYLGIILNNHLKWTEHIDLLKTKLRQLMYIFYNFNQACSKNIIREIYYAMAQSLLQYGITSWGGAYKNVLTKLMTTQNMLLRTILNKDRLFHTNELYRLFEVPTLTDLYLFKTATYAVKYKDNWTMNTNIYNTRQTGLARLPSIHKSLSRRHFSYLGAKIFNVIPEEIKAEREIKKVRVLLKQWLQDERNKEELNAIF